MYTLNKIALSAAIFVLACVIYAFSISFARAGEVDYTRANSPVFCAETGKVFAELEKDYVKFAFSQNIDESGNLLSVTIVWVGKDKAIMVITASPSIGSLVGKTCILATGDTFDLIPNVGKRKEKNS